MMKKFTQKIDEGKTFVVDPTLIKTYASFVIPFYISGKLKCDYRLVDEWLEMHKNQNSAKFANYVYDIEIMAVKAVLENPMTQAGYENLQKEVASKCPKLERFLRQMYQDPGFFK
jgi:hypothetical protein